jgi:hypothetical protein
VRSGEGESRRVKDFEIGRGVGRLEAACMLRDLTEHAEQQDHGGIRMDIRQRWIDR